METLCLIWYKLKQVNNRNTRTRCEICSNLTIKKPCSSVFILNFKQVIVGWVTTRTNNQADICLFKVDKWNTRTMCEIFENLSLFTVSDADIKTMRNFSQLTIITSLLSTNNKMETIALGTCLFECFPSFEL